MPISLSMTPVSILSFPGHHTALRCAPVTPPGAVRLADMAKLRLFASAREAAGTGSDAFDGATVADVLAAATQRYGSGFAEVLATCRIWVNGNDVAPDTLVGPHDEVAVLPPVSGGST
jgi:molybdopterin synthase sulfur carrier subunit